MTRSCPTHRLSLAGLLVLVTMLAGCGPAASGSTAASSSATAPSSATSGSAASGSAASGSAASGSAASGSVAPGSAASGSVAGSGGRASVAGSPSSTLTPDSRIRVNTVQIVVIGDSLTSGNDTPGYPWTTPAQQIFDRARLPAHIVNSSVSGIGYQAAGSAGVTFADLVRQVVTPRTNIVVLFGSDNDTASPSFAAAVESTVDLVQQRAPSADVVIVGPPVTPAQNGRDLSGIIDSLKQVAGRAGATFVDASGWFAGRSEQLLSSDGEHPNDDGEKYLGEKFAALLEPLIRQQLHPTGTPASPSPMPAR